MIQINEQLEQARQVGIGIGYRTGVNIGEESLIADSKRTNKTRDKVFVGKEMQRGPGGEVALRENYDPLYLCICTPLCLCTVGISRLHLEPRPHSGTESS